MKINDLFLFIIYNCYLKKGVVFIEKQIEQFVTDCLQIENQKIVKKLVDCGEICEIKEKEVLFCQGCKPDKMVFLIKGIMRSFVINENGVDLTECFDFQDGCPVVPSIPINAPASVNVEASVDSVLLTFPIDVIWELMSTDVNISQMYNMALCYSMQKYVQFTRVLIKSDATERYKWFLSEYSELNGKVRNKDIASFLNISPVTLSNIKKKLKAD